MSSSASEVAYLARALKMPRIPKAAKVFAERARDEGWDYEAFLAAVLSEETNQREVRGSDARIKTARFPQIKTLDDFDFSFQRSVKRTTIAHLAQLDFLAEAKNVVFLGPPGTGKTHLSIALGVQACRRAQRVAFATAHESIASVPSSGPAGSTKSSSVSDACPVDRRRGRLHPLRSRSRGAVLRADQLPLRAFVPHPQLQQDLFGMG